MGLDCYDLASDVCQVTEEEEGGRGVGRKGDGLNPRTAEGRGGKIKISVFDRHSKSNSCKLSVLDQVVTVRTRHTSEGKESKIYVKQHAELLIL